MTEKKSAWRSPWVIAWVAMVVIFFTMNMIMIYLAIDNKPGLVVDDFYERGQDYEKNMLKRQARDPGWTMRVELPRRIAIDQPVLCRFSVTDRDGGQVSRDEVTFYAYRPSDVEQDFSVPMKQVEPGFYEAQVSFPLKGAWDILVSIRNGEDEYNTPKRIGVGIDWIP
ncbi:MAG: FixH family protein [Candidatus Thiodiazotropha sp. (ex Epidulcina cf. delphinae)]|nr:FixH family protein [Candidatus Thiodiazotropha sp. (ex Epidulcina cf. delphinae)]